jgi:predicted methyltransferase
MEENEKIYLEFLEASKKTGVSIKKILDIFWYLSKNKTIKNNKLIQQVGISRNAINQVKEALSFYLNSPSQKTSLKKDLIEKVAKLYDKSYLTEENFLEILTKNKNYQKAVTLLSYYKNKRPLPQRTYDQFTATIETTAKRVSLMSFLGDLKNKKILFLGDDDFTSLPTASLQLATMITVLDIDERILYNLQNISDKLNLKIETIKDDLRKPLPKKLRENFDIVFTDPPYTSDGLKLFLSRAIESLDKKNQTARIYFCYGNSDRAKERFLPIQEIITSLGLMIRWVFDKFNRYEKAESIGSSSSLYIVEITPKTKPLLLRNYEKIYTID